MADAAATVDQVVGGQADGVPFLGDGAVAVVQDGAGDGPLGEEGGDLAEGLADVDGCLLYTSRCV